MAEAPSRIATIVAWLAVALVAGLIGAIVDMKNNWKAI
jgi:hypothetical protein